MRFWDQICPSFSFRVKIRNFKYHIYKLDLLWLPNFIALRLYFIFGTTFTIDACFNVKYLLLGGYCLLLSGYCSLLAGYWWLLLVTSGCWLTVFVQDFDNSFCWSFYRTAIFKNYYFWNLNLFTLYILFKIAFLSLRQAQKTFSFIRI